MIGRVYHGCRVGGLVAYLYGPGRHNEHESPHLVASWSGSDAGTLSGLEPVGLAQMPLGQADYSALTSLLEVPVMCAERAVKNAVWHCPLRTAPGDRRLSDEEWAQVAEDVMDRTGIAPRGDEGACRWVAVRHDEDSIHIVATLARQDGQPFWVSNDYFRVREACRAAESMYGLTETAPADSTTSRHTTRAEREKALRAGETLPDREWLREQVTHAASASRGVGEFLDRLRAGGVAVGERRNRDGAVVGYSVGRCGAAGVPVMFGGGKLARELTLPKLEQKWVAAGGVEQVVSAGPVVASATQRAQVWAQASAAAGRAAELVRADPAQGADAAAAASEILAAASRLIEGRDGGPLAAAARDYDRAARERYRVTPARSEAGSVLRAAALAMARSDRRRPGRGEAVRAARLVAQMARLSGTIAQLRAAQGRMAQANAAMSAARGLSAAGHQWSAVAEKDKAGRGAATSSAAPAVRRAPAAGPPARREGRGR